MTGRTSEHRAEVVAGLARGAWRVRDLVRAIRGRIGGPIRLLQRYPPLQGVAAALFIMSAATAWAWSSYVAAADAYRHTIRDHLLTFARVAATHVDPEAHARLVRPAQQNGPEYLAVVAPLRRLVRATAHIHYIYTLRPTADGLRFVVDSGLPRDTDGDGVIDQAPLGEPCTGGPHGLRAAARAGRSFVTAEPYTDRWGSFLSGYAPVRHADGRLECLVAADMDLAEYRAYLAQLRRTWLLGCGLTLALSVFAGGCIAAHQRARYEITAKLAASEQRYALAVNGASDGLWDLDTSTGRIYCSGRVATMLGFPDNHLPPTVTLDWFYEQLVPDDRRRVREAMESHLARGTPYDIEYRLRSADGGSRWFQARGEAVRDATGRAVRMVGSLADADERVRLRRRFRRASLRDELTGLPNRAALLHHLRRALRRRRHGAAGRLALLYLDFDRFKIVNDSLGHEAGDALLVAIAGRLRTSLRDTDAVARGAGPRSAARLGGDEFVVLLEGLESPESAIAVASRLLDVLTEPYAVGAGQVTSNASIGIVLGDSTDRAEDLLRDADTAMYEAKAAGRGGFAIFDETMRGRVRRRLQIEQGLRAAIADDRLRVEYQPIVCLTTGRLVCAEALARWDHPVLGPVGPAEFIPVAEECGLIGALGERVNDRAFHQLARWQAEASDGRPARVSVNLARRQLMTPGLARWLRAAVDRAHIEPGCVTLEITEGSMMHDVAAARAALCELHAVGFRLAIDDFGTGHSSLACLHQFPFDLLKLDRSFVQGSKQSDSRTAIIRMITTLASTLGFRVVAEGIETAEQATLMRDLGCDYGQGFRFPNLATSHAPPQHAPPRPLSASRAAAARLLAVRRIALDRVADAG